MLFGKLRAIVLVNVKYITSIEALSFSDRQQNSKQINLIEPYFFQIRIILEYFFFLNLAKIMNNRFILVCFVLFSNVSFLFFFCIIKSVNYFLPFKLIKFWSERNMIEKITVKNDSNYIVIINVQICTVFSCYYKI